MGRHMMHARETNMGPQSFQTRMGQRWYEVTSPKIATELERLADNIAALNETLVRVLEASGCHDNSPAKLCVKCGTVLVDPPLRGEERCAQCGDES